MKILITGDFVVNKYYAVNELIDSEISSYFKKSDYNIVNLEAPVTNNTSKILKTGPHIKSERVTTANVLNLLNVNVATLSNNHILDYGEIGVKDTLLFCKENNILTVGAGKNLKEASKILYLNSTEGRIAIVNIAENEWASATNTSGGANPMDIIDNVNQIKKAKEVSDYIILIIHGGHEYYNLPNPRIQKQYRFYAEQGVDLIVCHHPHCISGFEFWNDVPIYYSLGNFLFTKESKHRDWYEGLILEVNIESGKLKSDLHPIKQDINNFKLEFLKDENRNEVLAKVNYFSEIIADEKLLQKEWQKYIHSVENIYLNHWSPISFLQNKYLSAFINKIGFNMINKKGLSLFLNLLRCESHSDLSKEVMTKYLKK